MKTLVTFLVTLENCTIKQYFFSTDHCQQIRSTVPLPASPSQRDWVPCTIYLPYHIVPREGFEDGVIKDKDDYIRFRAHCGDTLIKNPDPAFDPDLSKKEI